MKHEAIYRAYPNVVTVDDGEGAYDKDGNCVELDLKLIEETQKQINKEIAQKEAEQAAKVETALAKLAALGLTIDDLKALGLA